MYGVVKKVVSLVVCLVVSAPLFASPSLFKLSAGAGVTAKHQFVEGAEEVDLESTAKLSLNASLENNSNSLIPFKITANFIPEESNFWEEGIDYNITGTFEMKLLGLGGIKAYLGGGVVYHSDLKTEENEIKDCLTSIVSAQVSIALSETMELVGFAQLPIDNIRAIIDQHRGQDVDFDSVTPANVGVFVSFGLI